MFYKVTFCYKRGFQPSMLPWLEWEYAFRVFSDLDFYGSFLVKCICFADDEVFFYGQLFILQVYHGHKHHGMTHTTVVLQRMAINTSKVIGREGRSGGEVALYVRECFDYLELNNGENSTECLWVRLRGKDNKTGIMVGICYRPLSQDKEVDEIFSE